MVQEIYGANQAHSEVMEQVLRDAVKNVGPIVANVKRHPFVFDRGSKLVVHLCFAAYELPTVSGPVS